jgi:hypothetical protein
VRVERLMIWLVGSFWGAAALGYTVSFFVVAPSLQRAAIYLFWVGALAWLLPPLVAIAFLCGEKVRQLMRR